MKSKEVSVRYDDVCGVPVLAGNTKGNQYCSVEVTMPAMNGPVYFYYKLVNFYQNHRRYVKSRGDDQLRGVLSSSVADCDPLSMHGKQTIYPCGLIANSFFNDVFSAQLCTVSSGFSNCSVLSGDNWLNTGIAWSSDVQNKFLTPPDLDQQINSGNLYLYNTYNVSLPKVTNEEFIVWMRTAGLPTFKKLNRRILNQNFQNGDVVTVNISNNFYTQQFSGEKWIVFGTTSWLGGQNPFLGWAYISVGIACVLLAIGFGIKEVVAPRKLGDMSYFRWNLSK